VVTDGEERGFPLYPHIKASQLPQAQFTVHPLAHGGIAAEDVVNQRSARNVRRRAARPLDIH